MEPAFFGEQKSPLFGIYHPSQKSPARNRAVLICNPLFQEYIRSHRVLRQLADQLAFAGHHVFRFDYAGTGDSAGSLDDVSLATWQENIAQAEAELKDLSGSRDITLIGLRFGATLAAMHSSRSLKKLVLWDPVINGQDYISRLHEMHQSALTDVDRFPIPRQWDRESDENELLGFKLPEVLRQELLGASISTDRDDDSVDIKMIVSEETTDYNAFKSKFEPDGGKMYLEVVSGPGDWYQLEKLEDMLMPAEILKKIVSIA